MISLILTPMNYLLTLQGKDVNLFQPAREFLPMIDEVNIIFFFLFTHLQVLA